MEKGREGWGAPNTTTAPDSSLSSRNPIALKQVILGTRNFPRSWTARRVVASRSTGPMLTFSAIISPAYKAHETTFKPTSSTTCICAPRKLSRARRDKATLTVITTQTSSNTKAEQLCPGPKKVISTIVKSRSFNHKRTRERIGN